MNMTYEIRILNWYRKMLLVMSGIVLFSLLVLQPFLGTFKILNGMALGFFTSTVFVMMVLAQRVKKI